MGARASRTHTAALRAQRCVLGESKRRRDARRTLACKERTARLFELRKGSYLSWGYGSSPREFDEYFGEVDPVSLLPHGAGARYYSDGTVYFGRWAHGLQHDPDSGSWTRPSGLTYLGGWVNGKKHGAGRLVYPLSDAKHSYDGQFAAGCEHGQGALLYRDRSAFRGKFRFGLRDGQGVHLSCSGESSRGVFKDRAADATVDEPPPRVYEDVAPARSVANPRSLLELGLAALCRHVLVARPRSALVEPAHIHRAVNAFAAAQGQAADLRLFKQLMVHELYRVFDETAGTAHAKSSTLRSRLLGGALVFESASECAARWTRLSEADAEAIALFQGGNPSLRSLCAAGCSLSGASLAALARQLPCWTALVSLDLSYNALQAVEPLLAALPRSIKVLRLQACALTLPHIATLAASDGVAGGAGGLSELDVSFNRVGDQGCSLFAQLLGGRCSLAALLLRAAHVSEQGAACLLGAMRGARLRVLNVSDNGLQPATVVAIATRLDGSFTELARSFVPGELALPRRYASTAESF